jgi:hypothetical protein
VITTIPATDDFFSTVGLFMINLPWNLLTLPERQKEKQKNVSTIERLDIRSASPYDSGGKQFCQFEVIETMLQLQRTKQGGSIWISNICRHF